MKKINIMGLAFLCLTLATQTGCKTEGCTDPNAHNYSASADKNSTCTFRYASNIDISNVPGNRPNNTAWDGGDGPDLKLNLSKNSSSGYDYSTNTADNTNNATLTTNSSVKFTNETWKYELVDVDALGSETIIQGTFNPLQSTNVNEITVTNGGVTIKFKYTIQ